MSKKFNFLVVCSLPALTFLPMKGQAAVYADALKHPDTNPEIQMILDASAYAGAEGFIGDMAQRAIDFLGDEALSPEQRRQSFKKLLNSSFDMNTIARFALGRHWNSATESQRQEYLKLFRDMVIDVYSKRFEEYNGQELKVSGSREDGKDIIVTSFIIHPGNPDVQVDWRVRKKDGGFKVVDVIVEGVSMTLTQRSDFASVIQRGGGQISALIEHMKQ